MINAATLQRHISADRLKTLAPEQLAAAPDILDILETIIVLVQTFPERGTRKSELRILLHCSYQKLEVIRLEGDVGVQVADDFEVQIFHPLVSSIEGMRLPREMPFLSLWHPYQFNPWIVRHVPAHNLVGTVGRPVAHDDPF